MSALRFVAALLVLLALQFMPGVSAAATTIQQASASADAFLAGWTNATCTNQSGVNSTIESKSREHHPFADGDGGNKHFYSQVYCRRNTLGTVFGPFSGYHSYDTGCPVSTLWDEGSKTCFDGAVCLAKPSSEPQTYVSESNYAPSAINVDGCEFVPDGDVLSVCSGGWCSTGSKAGWRPSGNPYASNPDGLGDPETDGQKCLPAPDGQTICSRPDGRICASAGQGRELCWRAGETGEKVDGEVLQVRNTGNTPATPQTLPPPGETFESFRQPVQTMACYGYFRDENNCGTAAGATGGLATTIQNYRTATGANAGGSRPDEGQNADGTSGSSPGNAGTGSTPGDADGNGQPDWTEGAAPGIPGEGDPEPGDAPGPPTGLSVGVGLLDQTGILGSAAACPELGVIDFGELGTFDLNSVPMWCDLVSIMRAIVLLIAAFAAMKILMGAD